MPLVGPLGRCQSSDSVKRRTGRRLTCSVAGALPRRVTHLGTHPSLVVFPAPGSFCRLPGHWPGADGLVGLSWQWRRRLYRRRPTGRTSVAQGPRRWGPLCAWHWRAAPLPPHVPFPLPSSPPVSLSRGKARTAQGGSASTPAWRLSCFPAHSCTRVGVVSPPARLVLPAIGGGEDSCSVFCWKATVHCPGVVCRLARGAVPVSTVADMLHARVLGCFDCLFWGGGAGPYPRPTW